MLPHDRILLIEDDDNEIELMCHALEETRITNRLHCVRSFEEGMSYLAGEGGFADRTEHPLPCLILLDIKLGGRSGLDLLQWLRTRPELQRIPVVVLTHSQDSGDIERAYALGANSYVVKPIEPELFRSSIQALNTYWNVLAEKPRV